MAFSFTEQACQAVAVVGLIPSTNHATNTGDNSIAGINALNFKRILAILEYGVSNNNASNNIQLYWRASATSNMASPTNVASAIPLTINTGNNAGNDNMVALAEVRADQLPANTQYVQPILIVNNAAVFCSLTVLGLLSSYGPTSQFDIVNTVQGRYVT
jgi:hypothetical protein